MIKDMNGRTNAKVLDEMSAESEAKISWFSAKKRYLVTRRYAKNLIEHEKIIKLYDLSKNSEKSEEFSQMLALYDAEYLSASLSVEDIKENVERCGYSDVVQWYCEGLSKDEFLAKLNDDIFDGDWKTTDLHFKLRMLRYIAIHKFVNSRDMISILRNHGHSNEEIRKDIVAALNKLGFIVQDDGKLAPKNKIRKNKTMKQQDLIEIEK